MIMRIKLRVKRNLPLTEKITANAFTNEHYDEQI